MHIWKNFLLKGIGLLVFLAFIEAGPLSTSGASSAPKKIEENQEQPSSSLLPSKHVPFAGYEERLSQSPQWQRMSPEEREQAIQKIQRFRQQYQKRVQELEAQYQGLTELKKGIRALKYKQVDQWRQYQALPTQKRLEWEKNLGLDGVLPSQRREKFSQHLRRLPFSESQRLLKDLERGAP